MKNYGLVFKYKDVLCLAKYIDGILQEAGNIDDKNDIYKDFDNHKISFVEVNEYQQDVVTLTDLKVITIKGEEDAGINELIDNNDLSDMAQDIWEELKDTLA